MTMKSGERARRTGALHCDRCQLPIHVHEGRRVPQCPMCGNDRYEEPQLDDTART